MEIIGTVKKINDIQIFDSGFKKRELIIVINEKYPQSICVEFFQDRIDLLNYIKEGDYIKVFINLRGREWTSSEGVVKYFNSIQGWRIEKLRDSKGMQDESDNNKNNNNVVNNDSSDHANFNDLPF